MSKNRDDFSAATKRMLAERVGWYCSFPRCAQITLGPSQSEQNKRINNGIAAHICAASKNGPRYDPSMTPMQRKSIENGIWMCRNHASLIDSDFNTYTVEDIKSWKVIAEEKASQRLLNQQSSVIKQGDYSSQDHRAFNFINEILPYETIKMIHDEPFGEFVPDCIFKPFSCLVEREGDPLYRFDNKNIESLRSKLVDQAWEFIRYFSKQSAGRGNGYEYINISEFRRWNPSVPESYWIDMIEETSRLAREFCKTAMDLREMQRDL